MALKNGEQLAKKFIENVHQKNSKDVIVSNCMQRESNTVLEKNDMKKESRNKDTTSLELLITCFGTNENIVMLLCL